MSSKYRSVYFDEDNQKIRWTQSAPEGFVYNYEYVGEMTRVEFDMFIEILWDLYEDKKISFDEFCVKFSEIRTFSDTAKSLIDELLE